MALRVHVPGRVLNLPSARPRLRPRGGRTGFVTVDCEFLIPYLNKTHND
jgi:hypothetical protein